MEHQAGEEQESHHMLLQAVAMLSSVLSSETAVEVNIQIIRIFTRIRQMLADHTELRLEVEKIKKKRKT